MFIDHRSSPSRRFVFGVWLLPPIESRLVVRRLLDTFARKPSSPGPWTVCGVSSGIHSAIYGKIRSRDVGGFRTLDKRRHCGDLLNIPIAFDLGGGLLRHRPIPRSGIQLRFPWTPMAV